MNEIYIYICGVYNGRGNIKNELTLSNRARYESHNVSPWALLTVTDVNQKHTEKKKEKRKTEKKKTRYRCVNRGPLL